MKERGSSLGVSLWLQLLMGNRYEDYNSSLVKIVVQFSIVVMMRRMHFRFRS